WSGIRIQTNKWDFVWKRHIEDPCITTLTSNRNWKQKCLINITYSTYMQTQTHTLTHTHTHTHSYTHTYIHTRTHTNTHIHRHCSDLHHTEQRNPYPLTLII